MSTITDLANDAWKIAASSNPTSPKIEGMPTFWNWELVYTCNYRCSYCGYTALGWESHYPMNAYPGLKRLTEVWTRLHGLYGRCHIEISGGECSTYPDFYDLLGMLTGLHTLTIDTNLSFDVERFAARANLGRIRVSTSFHPQFADFESYLAKCLYLKEKGIAQIFVNYVAYPDQLRELPAYKRRLKDAGILCFVQPFQGVYKKQKVYPNGYTEEEKSLIEEALSDNWGDSKISRVRFGWKGHTMRSSTEHQLLRIEADRRQKGEETISDKEPKKWSRTPWQNPLPMAEDKPKREPVLCRMGQKYAKVYANGDAFRCCAQLREDMPWRLFKESVYLGNLFLDDEVKLLDKPALCDYEPCPCDRCMVVGQEDRWTERWVAPKV